MKSSKFISFLEDTSHPKSVVSLFLPTSLPSSLQNSENKKLARLKSTSLICGCHLSNVCAKFELGLFIRAIPNLLFLAIAAIIWKPSSFNDRNDRNDLNTINAAIVWKPGFRQNERRQRWITACHRADLFVCTKDSYICSIHFVGGNGPTNQYPDPISAVASKEKVRLSVFLFTTLFNLSFEILHALRR